MLKKFSPFLVFIMFGVAIYGQTIVTTSPLNQNVILEEFTGIYCGYCPDGHAIAQAIQDANPDRVSLINIHQGSFAAPYGDDPDFRTPYGNAIVAQSYSGTGFGYPSGTVNRHVFPGRSMSTGGGPALGRENWNISATETLAINSPVNLAVEAEINIATRMLTVHVEAYYTSNSPEITNLLNVALLQNNTLGPQSGGGQGDNYIHMHRLVELITGQWGEEISTTTTGTFVDRTYNYPIPLDYNDILAELVDMEIVAFISNTHQEIPSGSRTYPEFTGFTADNDAYARFIKDVPETCTELVTPVVNIQNLGRDPITSLAIEFEVNGDIHNYSWSGTINSLHNETIELPEVPFSIQPINTITVTLPSDENNSNNITSSNFNEAVLGTGTVYMELKTDNYGNECFWNLKDSNGTVLYSGSGYGNNQTINETFLLSEDCYTFSVNDTYGDGGGPVTLTDHLGTVVFYTNGLFGAGVSGQFSSNGVLGLNQHQMQDISLYPNPANETINLKNAENTNIEIFDITGKQIYTQENITVNQQINISSLKSGIYFINISRDNLTTTKKLLVAN